MQKPRQILLNEMSFPAATSKLRKSIPWNVFGVPVLSAMLCAVIAIALGYVLHSVLGYVTRINAEIGVIVFTLYGLITGIYGGWRNAYKLWRDCRVSRK